MDSDDRRLLRYLTAQRDDERAKEQGRRAKRKFNQAAGNNPFTSPADTQVSHAWTGRDPTAERAIGRADKGQPRFRGISNEAAQALLKERVKEAYDRLHGDD